MAAHGGEDAKIVAVHPGEILGEEIAARGITAHALALKLRVPANRISGIINGVRAITPETALRLGRYFGNSPSFWMNLQTAYDLQVAERELGRKIDAEVERAA
ncbi:MAG: HigA family addiction module antidote protein [Beijerinckiaceae bacterium]|nr:HigA family addiction module antidote protein [Beijerinckiaceae bacterium]